jgi:catechol 2,3-dioxygenase-like lactoylglutathione lyase family enzyme
MFYINPLVPELFCSNFDQSLKFYVECIGFEVGQRRRSDQHAYIAFRGAQLMLVRRDGTWETGPMERPFGRGVNFQFMVDDVSDLYARVTGAGYKPFLPIATEWYWRTDRMDERTQFAVLDPDGYFLRFAQVNRHRPVTSEDDARLDAEAKR